MAFALVPDDGPPRLIRFTTLGPQVLCELDSEKNLLLIDKAKYERLSPEDQHLVLRSQVDRIVLPPTTRSN
jgi:hypothetical protein